MPIIRHQYILRLELPIYNPIAMQHFHSIYNLCYQLPNHILIELHLLLLQIEIYIPLTEILHNDIDFVLILESLADGGEDGVVADLLYGGALEEVYLADFLLVDYLHCVLTAGLFLLGQDDVAECASAEIFQ